MGLAWRLVKTRYAVTAFDGEGAKQAGGRWNSPGVGMVYTSDTLATAVLEMLAQDLPVRQLWERWSYLTVSFPDDLVLPVDPAGLPADWSATPAPPALQALGDEWIASRRSLLLAVPSAVVPRQQNFLINPDHPDRGALKISGPEPFVFDARTLDKLAGSSA